MIEKGFINWILSLIIIGFVMSFSLQPISMLWVVALSFLYAIFITSFQQIIESYYKYRIAILLSVTILLMIYVIIHFDIDLFLIAFFTILYFGYLTVGANQLNSNLKKFQAEFSEND